MLSWPRLAKFHSFLLLLLLLLSPPLFPASATEHVDSFLLGLANSEADSGAAKREEDKEKKG